jgi:hypothetical protein
VRNLIAAEITRDDPQIGIPGAQARDGILHELVRDGGPGEGAAGENESGGHAVSFLTSEKWMDDTISRRLRIGI